MNATTIRPEFIRLPKGNDSCPYTSMKRGVMLALTVPSPKNGFKPPVPAFCIKARGKMRGTWYIPFDALIAYITAQPTVGLKTEQHENVG